MNFHVAIIAPLGFTFLGLLIGSQELFMGGLIFTGLIIVAGILKRFSQ